jgi:L-cysteine desulfidase
MSWREALWSVHRMARVAILCSAEVAASTASAATLPWLKFGSVAMMIDALGFKVRGGWVWLQMKLGKQQP